MFVKMNRGYKFLLKPNKEQAIVINKTIGCSRKVYNLLLADKIQFYKDNKSMLKRTPAYYKNIPEYVYLKEVDYSALDNTQINLEKAYTNFFQKKSNFPKFHKKVKMILIPLIVQIIILELMVIEFVCLKLDF